MSTESTQPIQYAAALGAVTLAYYLVPYLRDPHDYRHRFSGPWLAGLSSWWVSYAALAGKQCDSLREQHEKYGKFVRIGPNHISISDPDALEAVYGHRSGALKSDFYDNPGAGAPSIFSERNKAEHTRMRKRIANIFSQQNVLNFEPRVREHIIRLCEQWDLRCKEAVQGASGSNWTAQNGYALMDCCAQFSYLTFDIIGDLALGAPFGLIQAQKDSSPIIESVDKFGQPEKETIRLPVVEAIASINRNLASTGPFPLWTRYLMKILPWNIPSLRREIRFFKLAIAVVDARLKRGPMTMSDGSQGVDFIDKLLQVRNEDGSEMSRDELYSETLTMLLAGSDTSSNTLSSLCYYLAIHPDMQRELQSELDKHVPVASSASEEQTPPMIPSGDVVPDYEHIKNLPYLNACVKEALRIHSTIGMGLPRVVPPGKTLTVAGQTFKAGSVISVPSYMTHRSSIWGADASEFRPERWLDENAGSFNKYFAPFSLGPRSCIGRNLAYMELMLIAATVFRRYSIEAIPETKMNIDDTFIRAVVDCQVAFKRRDLV